MLLPCCPARPSPAPSTLTAVFFVPILEEKTLKKRGIDLLHDILPTEGEIPHFPDLPPPPPPTTSPLHAALHGVVI